MGLETGGHPRTDSLPDSLTPLAGLDRPESLGDGSLLRNRRTLFKTILAGGGATALAATTGLPTFADGVRTLLAGGGEGTSGSDAEPSPAKPFPEKLGSIVTGDFEVINRNARIVATSDDATIQLLSQKTGENNGKVQTLIEASMEDAKKAVEGEASSNTWDFPIPISLTDQGLTDIGWVYQKINANGVLEQHIGFIDGAVEIIERQNIDVRFPGVDVKAHRLNDVSFSVSLVSASSAQFPTQLPPSRPEMFDQQHRHVYVIDPELKRVASEEDPLLKFVLV